MSKVEAMRALRESMRATEQRMTPKVTKAAAAAPVPSAASANLCGHRSMSNKACIRPADHVEKNHRYTKTEKRG